MTLTIIVSYIEMVTTGIIGTIGIIGGSQVTGWDMTIGFMVVPLFYIDRILDLRLNQGQYQEPENYLDQKQE